MNTSSSQAPGADVPSWGTPTTVHPGSGTDSGEERPGTSNVLSPVFAAVRRLGVVRPDDDRVIGGVAAAIARRLGIAPVAVRIGFGLLVLAAGLGVGLYGLCWLLLPHPDGRIHLQEVLSGTVTPGFLGALAVTFIGTTHIHGPLLLVAVSLGVWTAARRCHSRQRAA
jgi:phage shock protein PspC (stress-responsive transcriptional regulator)